MHSSRMRTARLYLTVGVYPRGALPGVYLLGYLPRYSPVEQNDRQLQKYYLPQGAVYLPRDGTVPAQGGCT